MTEKNKIIIVGSPNVGKSLIFNHLTGSYSAVSNYPGTSVEVFRGIMKYEGSEFEVADTPGMYSLMPVTEEELVARNILFEEKAVAVIQVVDAKNLERMLVFTLQLIEAGLPMVLAVNMIDEAEKLGITINAEKLQTNLGIPVILTVATDGKNLEALKSAAVLRADFKQTPLDFSYSQAIEEKTRKVSDLLGREYELSKKTVSLLLMVEDAEIIKVVCADEKNNCEAIKKETTALTDKYRAPMNYLITAERQSKASAIYEDGVTVTKAGRLAFNEVLSRFTMNPWTGVPIFILCIFLLYEFVGVLGAQVLVKYFEEVIFGKYINPPVETFVKHFITWPVLQDLFVNKYGIITLGVRYAVALILPIVTTFFIAFSIIEDTGYLPRLAMLIDRVFKKFGLNGRAVIPIVLGFGCNTMATIVTRTLETKRERVIASFLLALAIPCSAQLGIIFALLSGVKALAIWLIVMISVFVVVGWLTAQLLPGEKPIFYMEVPPLRLPKLKNVFVKTYTRVEWYFKEVFPLFIAASVIIWVGNLTGIFAVLVKMLEYPMQWIGLPKEAAVAFLFGFFRRDYGAAGLYDLKLHGLISGVPLVVAAVTIAIFVPCIAQFAVTIKERGIKAALLMAAFIFPFAFFMGWLVNTVLTLLKVTI